jgi:hypothetical protein
MIGDRAADDAAADDDAAHLGGQLGHPACSSTCRLPGVDREDLARDASCHVAAEKDGGIDDVVGRDHAVEGERATKVLRISSTADAARLGLTGDDLVDAVALDGAGATQLTRMLCGASSSAMPKVMPTWPALAAQ